MNEKIIFHDFPFSWETLVRARELRYQMPELWSEVDYVKELSREEKEGFLKINRQIRLKNQLPQIIRQYFQMEVFEVEDWVICDYKKKELKAIAKLETLGGKFLFEQSGLYYEVSPMKSERRLEIKAKAEFPLVGELIEKIFLLEFSRRTEKDRKLILYLAQNYLKDSSYGWRSLGPS